MFDYCDMYIHKFLGARGLQIHFLIPKGKVAMQS